MNMNVFMIDLGMWMWYVARIHVWNWCGIVWELRWELYAMGWELCGMEWELHALMEVCEKYRELCVWELIYTDHLILRPVLYMESHW